MSIWKIPNKNELKISDIVTYVYPGKVGTTYGHMELHYHQESNQLCRFLGLYPFFFEKDQYGNFVGNKIEWNDFHNFLTISCGKNTQFTKKDILRMLFHEFFDNKNIAISTDYDSIRLVEKPKWRDESFEEYRHRRIWEIQNALGISHYGFGKELAQRPTSKYYKG